MKLTVEEAIAYYKSRRMIVLDKVYRLKIEAMLGCNRDCEFCGMTRKDTCMMQPELFNIILSKTPDTIKRIEFILHGEPTMNPNLLDYVKAIRDKFPKVQISVCSNGFRFLGRKYDPDYVFELFNNGLNILQVDCYDMDSWESFKKLIQENKTGIIEKKINVRNLYSQTKNLFFSYRGNKNREIIYVNELSQNSGAMQQRRFHTFGGNVPVEVWKNYNDKYTDFSKFPLTGKGKSCVSLLKYIPIGANGDIYFCCRDASHTTIMGNIRNVDLEELWVSEEFQKVRYILKSTRRDLFPQCFLCSRFCYRDPLYVYWGKTTYSVEDCVQTVMDKTALLDDVLLDNLIKYQKEYPDRLPKHIERKIEESKKKYNL